MADLYGTNYKAKYQTVPESKIPRGEAYGHPQWCYDKYDLSVLGVTVAITDTLYMQKIPKGARVLEAWAKFPDFGGSGTVDIGWQASLETGTETASSNGLFASLDLKTAADCILMSQAAAAPGNFKQFLEEVQVVVVASEAINAVTGTLELGILYVID